MKSRSKTLLAGAAVLVIAVAAVLLFRPNPPAPSYPVPNGYDDLVKAAAAVQQLPGQSGPLEPNKLSAEERQWLVESNRAALLLLRQGLAKEIRMVIPSDPASTQPMDYASSLKHLGRLLAIDAQAARDATNHAASLEAGLDQHRLGWKGVQGGRLIEGLVGCAVRQVAATDLAKLAQTGDAAICREAARRLQEAANLVPPVSAYIAEEDAWLRTLPFSQRFPGVLVAQFNGSQKAFRQNFAIKMSLAQNAEAAAIRDLAAAAFRLEHNRAATNWTELVPAYLPEIPRNATNNAPLPLVGP
jgi:hypothetical protein